MRLTAPMFSGTVLSRSQQTSPLAQAVHFPPASDSLSLNRKQPRFGTNQPSALEKACDHGKLDSLATLVVYSTQDEKDQALLRAVSQEKPSKAVIEVLLEAQANPGADDGTGRTALTEAEKRNHPDDIISLLKVAIAKKNFSKLEKETVKIHSRRTSSDQIAAALKKSVGEGYYKVQMLHNMYTIQIPRGSMNDLLQELGLKKQN